MDLWFRTWNTIQYFSLLESETSFLIIEGKWFSLFSCWVFSWILFFCCWLIFFRELWQVKAKCLYCQVQCGQDQPGVRRGRLFLGGQGCHGTIIRMSHIHLVWERDLRNSGGTGCEVACLCWGPWTWSLCDVCNALWHDSMVCTLWVRKALGSYAFKVIY